MNEQELLKQLSLGNREAFSDIYSKYHRGIYNYLLKFSRDPAFTEDLVHDVFLKLWEAREQLDVKSSFASYLYRIARNTALTQLNRIAIYDTIRMELLRRITGGPADQSLLNGVESKNFDELFRKAVDELPTQRKEAFLLVRQQGLSYEEAADQMQISRNTLKQHLSLAVKSIRDYLLEHGSISLLMLLIAF
ncbi:MAG: RNA polymerase sigma factor [Pseudobacter sp.]|uniref:RNA polymerase sigma factor n=1 Tax=Pseudobacter sp. TaxID=2045420 RepID=UPI003F80EA18